MINKHAWLNVIKRLTTLNLSPFCIDIWNPHVSSPWCCALRQYLWVQSGSVATNQGQIWSQQRSLAMMGRMFFCNCWQLWLMFIISYFNNSVNYVWYCLTFKHCFICLDVHSINMELAVFPRQVFRANDNILPSKWPKNGHVMTCIYRFRPLFACWRKAYIDLLFIGQVVIPASKLRRFWEDLLILFFYCEWRIHNRKKKKKNYVNELLDMVRTKSWSSLWSVGLGSVPLPFMFRVIVDAGVGI